MGKASHQRHSEEPLLICYVLLFHNDKSTKNFWVTVSVTFEIHIYDQDICTQTVCLMLHHKLEVNPRWDKNKLASNTNTNPLIKESMDPYVC